MSPFARHPRLSSYVAATVVYGLAIALCFHTLLEHPGSRILSGFGDPTTTLRYIWVAGLEHRNPLFSFTTDKLMGAPAGVAQAPAIALGNGGLEQAFVMVFRGQLGLVGAWNAELLLVGFLATALAMFAFLRRLGCTFGACLVGGYIFAFSPAAFERANAGALAYIENWTFVLVAATLLHLHERRTLRAAAAAGVAIAVASYVSSDQGVLAGLMTLVFLAVELARMRERRERIRTAMLGGVAFLVGVAGLTPLLVLYVQERATVVEQTQFPLNEYYDFAASLSAYLVPDPRNPLFGWLASIHSADLPNETLYPGYVTLFLALAAVALLVRRNAWIGGSELRRRTVTFLAALAPVAFVMSLPPSYSIAHVSIPTPSDLIRIVSFPMRVYSRFGLLVVFALAGLGAVALSALAQRAGRRWRLLTPVAAALIVLELLPGSFAVVDINNPPPSVRWLATHPRGIVANYPISLGQVAATNLGVADSWYQVLDRDPAFEIFPIGSYYSQVGPSRSEGIRIIARDLTKPLTAGVLATEGVRYVVVHDDTYLADGDLVPRLDPNHYTLLKRFGSVSIFSVRARKVDINAALAANANILAALQGLATPTLDYGTGFNSPEPFEGTTSRWMIQDGQLELVNPGPSGDITLTGVAFSNQRPTMLELEDSAGRILGRKLIPTYAIPLRFGPLSVPSGSSSLTLVAAPGPEPLGGSDPREASVFLEPIIVAAVPGYLNRAGSSP